MLVTFYVALVQVKAIIILLPNYFCVKMIPLHVFPQRLIRKCPLGITLREEENMNICSIVFTSAQAGIETTHKNPVQYSVPTI